MSVAQQIGKYQIVETLGRGGFATVYKAIDTSFRKREVALKVLDAVLMHDADFVSRFQQEAEVMATLFHPNICVLFDVGEADGQYYLAMQYIAGQNLRDYVREKGPLSFDQITSVLLQIGAALDYAHAHNAIHRDVKPSNIIYNPEDGHATLTDFGIAKVREATTVFTTSGMVLGTPYYSSPEQAESKPLDGRSDLYSLGVVAYELCTGSVPFSADTTPSLYYKIVHEEPALPSKTNPRVAQPIEEVLLKAMAKSPEQRYQSGGEFATAFEAAAKRVQGEWLDTLYREAIVAAQKGDDDDAEKGLLQLLAVKPDHQDALALLKKAHQHRAWVKEYRELANTVATLRQRAVQLRNDAPEIPDSEGVLRLLGQRSNPEPKVAPNIPPVPYSAPAPVPKSMPSRSPWWWTLCIGVGVLCVGMLSMSTPVVPSEMRNAVIQAEWSNLLLGLGVSAVTISILALHQLRKR